MKKKKMCAVVTLVAFLLTLMPIAGFAAGELSNSLAIEVSKDKRAVPPGKVRYDVTLNLVTAVDVDSDYEVYINEAKLLDKSKVPVKIAVKVKEQQGKNRILVEKQAVEQEVKVKIGETVIATGKIPADPQLAQQAAADQLAANQVIELINRIDENNKEFAVQVKAARQGYEKLTVDQKLLVPVAQVNALELAEQKLVTDSQTRIDRVIRELAELAKVNPTDTQYQEKVSAARALYNQLSDQEKAKVTNYNQLEAAEANVSSMAKVNEVIVAIDVIRGMNLNDRGYEDKVSAARALYNRLSTEQKQQVKNYEHLVAAEQALSDRTEFNQVSADASIVATVNRNEETEAKDPIQAVISLRYADNSVAKVKGTVYVWAESVNTSGQVSSAFQVGKMVNGKFVDANNDVNYVYPITFNGNHSEEFTVNLLRAGEYRIKASLENPNEYGVNNPGVKDVSDKLTSPRDYNTVVVNAAVSDIKVWTMDIREDSSDTTMKDNVGMKDGDTAIAYQIANSKSTKYTVTLNADGQPIDKQDIELDVNTNNVTLSDEKITTNYNGEATFKVSGDVEGSYVVSLKAGKFDADLKVVFNGGEAVRVETKKAPEHYVATGSDVTIELNAYDINGNKVNGIPPKSEVEVLDEPSKSKVKAAITTASDDGSFDVVVSNIVKEGEYEVKISLDNGKNVRVSFEAKEQGKIVDMEIKYDVSSIALGANSGVATIVKSDAKGVTTESSAKDARIDLGVSGYAVAGFEPKTGKVTVKTDDKYVGDKVTVTAVDSKNGLVDYYTFTVADNGEGLSFSNTEAQTNVNNKITYSVVDGRGNKVALGSNVDIDVTAFVVEQPRGGKAYVNVKQNGEGLKTKGVETLTVSCNEEGLVRVQVMVKATDKKTNVSNYYTGTADINFGDGKAQNETMVTMFIGSTDFMIGGDMHYMDLAPFVKNNRTFVPVRALGDALDAETEWDRDTQVITVTKDGLTIKMSIGSNVITTSEGKSIVCDVAPFITGSRAVLPLRAAAEAFGCDVEAIYNGDGSTAGVIFTVK